MGITLKNNARTTLTSAITSLATTIYVDDTSSFPELDTGDYFYCTIESTSGAYEIVKVTQINATNFIVVRGQEDTIAVPFVAGARVELRITVQNLTDFLLTGSNVSDEAFGVSWNGDDEDAPSRNALYDKFVSLAQADISGLTTSSSPLFAGLNLPSGGVINFNAGDVTVTHASNALAFAGASSGYSFDAVVLPSANDAAALGASGTAWADLFLASGGVINFNAGDVTVTHSANALAFAGASSGYTFDALATGTQFLSSHNSLPYFEWKETGAGPDSARWRMYASGQEFAFQPLTDAGGSSGWFFVGYRSAGTPSALAFGTLVRPLTNDGAALGSTSYNWSDLFLASGGVINFNAGDVTVTHASNALAFAGASSGYSFDAVVLPSANDAAALGASGTAWADLFLASGGVINFDTSDVTITHASNQLIFAGASTGYSFDAAMSTTGNFTTQGGTLIVGKNNLATGTDIQLHYDNTTGYGRILWSKNNVTKWRMLSSASSDNFSLINDVFGSTAFSISGSANTFSFYGAALPSANDAAALGASGTAWADLFLASGGVINFNAGDVTITHSSDLLTIAGGNVTFGGADANVVNFYRSGAAAKTRWIETTGNNAWGIRNDANTLTFDYNGTDLITVSTIGFTTFQNDIALATGTDQYIYYDGALHLYKNGTGEGILISSDRSVHIYGGLLSVQGIYPMIQWYDTDGSANEKYWRSIANSTNWELQTVNDAYNTATVAFAVTRSGNTPTGAFFATNVYPSVNDGAALGSTSYNWSDLFLASGGVINFNAGDVSIAHSANLLTFYGAESGYVMAATSTYSTLTLERAQSHGSGQYIGVVSFGGRDSGANYLSGGYVSMYCSDATDGSEDTEFRLAIDVAGAQTERLVLNGTGLTPATNDVGSLGASGTAWSDLFLASGAVINFNAGAMTLTHSPGVLTFYGGTLETVGAFVAYNDISLSTGTDQYLYYDGAMHITKNGTGDAIGIDSSRNITTYGSFTFGGPANLKSYTVAGLPAGTTGDIAYASNGRKNGEGAGAGTGVMVFKDGSAWRACDTGATVAA